MTTDFASAVAVTIPILALAAGAEARGIRERLKQPDEHWERKFAEYSSAHTLDTAQPPSEVLEYFKGVPWVSKAYVIERLLAVLSAVMWLMVFVLLAIAELLNLVWLGSSAGPSVMSSDHDRGRFALYVDANLIQRPFIRGMVTFAGNLAGCGAGDAATRVASEPLAPVRQ